MSKILNRHSTHTHAQYKNPDIYIYTFIRLSLYRSMDCNCLQYHCKKKILDRGDEGEEGKQNLPIKQQQTENKGL